MMLKHVQWEEKSVKSVDKELGDGANMYCEINRFVLATGN